MYDNSRSIESKPQYLFRPERSTVIGLILAAVFLAVGAVVGFLMGVPIFVAVATAVSSSGIAPFVELIAEKGLLVQVAFAGLLAAVLWVKSRPRFWTFALAGLGVIASYATSELIKVLVAEPRPCSAVDVSTVLLCPGVGDWSWPSNHSVLAAAFATACILVVPRTGWLVAPAAALIAASRIGAGVHYLHDVLSGLSLGILVVLGVTLALSKTFNNRMMRVTDRRQSLTGNRHD